MNPYMKENNSIMYIRTPLEDPKHERTIKETIDKSLILISSWLMIVLTLYSLHFNSDIIVSLIKFLLDLIFNIVRSHVNDMLVVRPWNSPLDYNIKEIVDIYMSVM